VVELRALLTTQQSSTNYLVAENSSLRGRLDTAAAEMESNSTTSIHSQSVCCTSRNATLVQQMEQLQQAAADIAATLAAHVVPPSVATSSNCTVSESVVASLQSTMQQLQEKNAYPRISALEVQVAAVNASDLSQFTSASSVKLTNLASIVASLVVTAQIQTAQMANLRAVDVGHDTALT
jgi:hypothetical protein